MRGNAFAIVILLLFAKSSFASSTYEVKVTWEESDSTVTGVFVYRVEATCASVAGTGMFLYTNLTANAAAPAAGPYFDTDVDFGETYCYVLIANAPTGTSAPSDLFEVTIPDSPGVSPPTQVQGTVSTTVMARPDSVGE